MYKCSLFNPHGVVGTMMAWLCFVTKSNPCTIWNECISPHCPHHLCPLLVACCEPVSNIPSQIPRLQGQANDIQSQRTRGTHIHIEWGPGIPRYLDNTGIWFLSNKTSNYIIYHISVKYFTFIGKEFETICKWNC